MPPLTVGVLALQGDFREHLMALERLGASGIPVKKKDDLPRLDGLIIPGGESSVMDKLSRAFDLAEPLKEFIAAGMPVYGTCAGLIMLADTVVDGPTTQHTLGGLDVVVRRNAFGSQLDSFETELDVAVLPGPPARAVFIRAPAVERIGPGVEPLATLDDGRVVAVRQGTLLGTAFHPEMTGDLRFHEYFLDIIRGR